MAKTLVLTFVADDRPGLVEKLAETVSEQGGNWLESRMAHLAGKFSGIARVQIADDKIAALEGALAALEPEGFRLAIEEAGAFTEPTGPVYNLDLVGPDQPGIVRDMTHCLAERGASVEELETDVQPAPMGGGDLFYAKARVRLPPDLSEAALRQVLEALADALMVDLTLREEV